MKYGKWLKPMSYIAIAGGAFGWLQSLYFWHRTGHQNLGVDVANAAIIVTGALTSVAVE